MATATPINEMIGNARAWLDTQLAQTERLRPTLAIAAVVIFLGLLIATFSLLSSGLKDLRSAQTDLARLQQQLRDGSWAERKQQSETMRFQLNERFWMAETAGLAEASLERWLRDRLEKLGVRIDTIRIQRAAIQTASDSAKTAHMAGVQRMTAKVVMPFEPEAVMELLKAATGHEKILVVDRLILRGGRNSLIEMDVSTFVKLTEAPR